MMEKSKRHPITLNNPERFKSVPKISDEKLNAAIKRATDRLKTMGTKHGASFPYTCSVDSQYYYGENNNWVCGMYAGSYWLAYLLTRDNFFRAKAFELMDTFQERLDKKIGVDDHDVGFVFTPSIVASYKLTGARDYKATAIEAADYFYNTGYSKEGKFIIRWWKAWKEQGKIEHCRTMMDSLMNAPLLYWYAQETGNKEVFQAAHDHVKTTEENLVRADSSTYHHYQFDPETLKPLHGVTLQGRSDESCWSRGHAWGVYGFTIAYSYDKSQFIKDVQRDVTYYMLNHLPEDMIPYWDFDFTSGDEPRDASAGAISVCGMLEMTKYLDDSDPNKTVYMSAAAQMLEALIDKCSYPLDERDDGLLTQVTAAYPQKMGIGQTAVYGDYFYLEALLRYKNPDFKMLW